MRGIIIDQNNIASNTKINNMNKKISKRDPWGSLSCDAVRELIEKRKTQKLTPSERNAVFEHSTVCKECREIEIKELNRIIGDTKIEDL